MNAFVDEKIEKIIDVLDAWIGEEFGCDYDGKEELPYFYDIMRELEDIDEGIRMYHGVSKMCIVIPGYDFVLKVPFNGVWEYEDDYDEETDSWDRAEEGRFVPYFYANDINYEDAAAWDYCENELHKYLIAKDAGWGHMLAETCELRWLNSGIPVYAQEKVVVYDEADREKTPREEVEKFKESLGRKYRIADAEWLTCVGKVLGLEKTKAFVDFLYDNGMSEDLHLSNIGFKADGFPVILDYAGWRD